MTTSMRLPGQITLREARSVLDLLGTELTAQPGGASAGEVEVDASALTQFDSSALGVLVGLHRCAVASGRRLHLVGMPPRLTELARLYGVSELVALGTQGAA
jgi:phospholipid transport system transporter-binding protein